MHGSCRTALETSLMSLRHQVPREAQADLRCPPPTAPLLFPSLHLAAARELPAWKSTWAPGRRPRGFLPRGLPPRFSSFVNLKASSVPREHWYRWPALRACGGQIRTVHDRIWRPSPFSPPPHPAPWARRRPWSVDRASRIRRFGLDIAVSCADPASGGTDSSPTGELTLPLLLLARATIC